MMPEDDKFGPYSLHTWTVRMNSAAHEGRSVWEHCRIPKGTAVTLSVQNLPEMLCTIGQSANRISDAGATPPGAKANGTFGWVNRGVVRIGPVTPNRGLLTVGCELWVIPSWQLQLIETTAAIPAPINGDLSGVDIRPLQGHEVDRLQVWVATTLGAGDLVVPQVWLRHPSGIWARHEGAVLPVASGVYDIPIRDADRVAVSFVFSGAPSGQPVNIAYGKLTAPSVQASRQQFQIRFSAVVAPYK